MALSDQLERLAAAGIRLLPALEITNHYVFERGDYVALVERAGEGFGAVGSAGLLTGEGFAALVWRGGQAFFVRREFEQPASSDQVKGLRRFSEDLAAALNGRR